MTRRRRRPRLPEDQLRHIVGTRAGFNGSCPRCSDPIVPDDRVVRAKVGWVHARCAAGQDE